MTIKGEPTRKTPWRWTRRALVSAVVLLVLAEISLRLFFGLGHPLLYASDAACGYLPRPNQDINRFHHHARINQFGMRNDPIDAHKPPGTRRVLMVGNSVLFGGAQTDQKDVCSALLEQRLPKDLGQPVQVLNISAGGWAVENELQYLKTRGIFESEIVFMFLNTRDLKRDFAPGSSEDPNYPRSNPASALGELFQRYLLPRFLSRFDDRDKGSRKLGPGEFLDPAVVLDQLTEVHDIVTRAGAQLCIIYSPVNPHGGYWTPDDHLLVESLNAWATKHAAPVFDLSDAYAHEPEDHIYRDAIHINTGGQAAAAKALEPWMATLLRDRTSATTNAATQDSTAR